MEDVYLRAYIAASKVYIPFPGTIPNSSPILVEDEIAGVDNSTVGFCDKPGSHPCLPPELTENFKCEYCGQWGKKYVTCQYCGAPMP